MLNSCDGAMLPTFTMLPRSLRLLGNKTAGYSWMPYIFSGRAILWKIFNGSIRLGWQMFNSVTRH
ncbi:hypothetical protein D3C85_1391500 [compost metagenome]